MGVNKYLKVIALLFLFVTPNLHAETLKIAVSSNFKSTMLDLIKSFKNRTPHSVRLSFSSTGKHYAQIINGAPFDVFFAADSERPQKLERDGKAINGSRLTYAVGKLVLWAPKQSNVNRETLTNTTFTRLALANPRLAPYGNAAMQTLQALGLWNKLQERMIYGENIAQAFLFVDSSNADLGLVAYSQIILLDEQRQQSYWMVPQKLYTRIEQQAVMLKNTQASRDIMAFIKDDEAIAIIRSHGYGAP